MKYPHERVIDEIHAFMREKFIELRDLEIPEHTLEGAEIGIISELNVLGEMIENWAHMNKYPQPRFPAISNVEWTRVSPDWDQPARLMSEEPRLDSLKAAIEKQCTELIERGIFEKVTDVLEIKCGTFKI